MTAILPFRGEPPARIALEVAREHIRWCYRRGMTRRQIAASIGAPRWSGDRRGASLLVPLAAAWMSISEADRADDLDRIKTLVAELRATGGRP